MHKNPLWLIFLAGISLVTLWFCGVAFYRVYQYSRLNGVTDATNITWSILKLDEDNYFPYAHYSYLIREKEYVGEEALKEKEYKNEWAVKESLPEITSKQWQVWYDPYSPAFSSLQRHFPLKEVVSAILLLGIVLYFFGLGYYVAGHK